MTPVCRPMPAAIRGRSGRPQQTLRRRSCKEYVFIPMIWCAACNRVLIAAINAPSSTGGTSHDCVHRLVLTLKITKFKHLKKKDSRDPGPDYGMVPALRPGPSVPASLVQTWVAFATGLH